ncbi:TonB-dependent receptor domain-containing protein [Hydrogenophaga sp. OTU3427]|uniref:TonB-dependent receptor domain-containing protein n=1 Tax=Hydrogenophaga sp. OTU3427 TaxID=3043856 RepID=UPI00313D24A9
MTSRSSFGLPLAALPLALSVAGAQAQTTPPQLRETVVTATRVVQPLMDVVADVTVVDREAIERSGAVAVADVLARLPGVELARNGGAASVTGVFVRGAEPRFTAVFIDGVRVDSQSTGGATWNALPLAQIDRIELVRGPAAAVYGSDAMGGVVQIFTRKGEGAFAPSVSVGAGSHGLRQVQAGFSGSSGTIDYALSAADERSTGFDSQPGSNPDRDGHHNRSATARLGWQINPAHRLDATALSSRVNAQYDGYVPGDDDRSFHHLNTLGLTWQARWTDSYQTRVSASRGRDRYDSAPYSYLTETTVTSYLFHNEWRQGAHLFTAALERREDELDNVSTTPAISGRHQDALALGYGWVAGAHALQLNLRHDRDSEFGDKGTGSAAYAYSFAPGWRATASAGTAFRAPTLYQRFSVYGVPSLKPESGRNVEVGLRYAHQGTAYGLVAYRNLVSDLINYVPGSGPCANGMGEYAGCYANVARARYSGVTLSAARRVAGVHLSASLDLQSPRDLDTGLQLVRRAKRHASLAADTRVGEWLLGAELKLSGARFNDTANTQRLGGYGLVNLHASTPLAPDWSLLLRIDNLGDKDYATVRGYATPGRTLYAGLKWAPR